MLCQLLLECWIAQVLPVCFTTLTSNCHLQNPCECDSLVLLWDVQVGRFVSGNTDELCTCQLDCGIFHIFPVVGHPTSSTDHISRTFSLPVRRSLSTWLMDTPNHIDGRPELLISHRCYQQVESGFSASQQTQNHRKCQTWIRPSLGEMPCRQHCRQYADQYLVRPKHVLQHKWTIASWQSQHWLSSAIVPSLLKSLLVCKDLFQAYIHLLWYSQSSKQYFRINHDLDYCVGCQMLGHVC